MAFKALEYLIFIFQSTTICLLPPSFDFLSILVEILLEVTSGFAGNQHTEWGTTLMILHSDAGDLKLIYWMVRAVLDELCL